MLEVVYILVERTLLSLSLLDINQWEGYVMGERVRTNKHLARISEEQKGN